MVVFAKNELVQITQSKTRPEIIHRQNHQANPVGEHDVHREIVDSSVVVTLKSEAPFRLPT